MRALLHGTNWVLLIAGFVLVFGTIFSQADMGLSVFAIPMISIFVALAFVPYVPFGVLNRRTERPLTLFLCTLALLALSAFWIWGFGSTFWWNERPDAQDGLVLIFVPAYMIVGAGLVGTAIWAIDRYL